MVVSYRGFEITYRWLIDWVSYSRIVEYSAYECSWPSSTNLWQGPVWVMALWNLMLTLIMDFSDNLVEYPLKESAEWKLTDCVVLKINQPKHWIFRQLVILQRNILLIIFFVRCDTYQLEHLISLHHLSHHMSDKTLTVPFNLSSQS
jgi:hypothetical protein